MTTTTAALRELTAHELELAEGAANPILVRLAAKLIIWGADEIGLFDPIKLPL
jgi:hypothetical protein